MLTHIAAEMRHVGETELGRNLLDGQVGVAQVEADVLGGVLYHPVRGRLVAVLQAEHGEVLRRDGQLAGILRDGLPLHIVARDQLQELVEKHLALRKLLLAHHDVGSVELIA